MSKLRVVMIEVEGDEAAMAQAMRTFSSMIDQAVPGQTLELAGEPVMERAALPRMQSPVAEVTAPAAPVKRKAAGPKEPRIIYCNGCGDRPSNPDRRKRCMKCNANDWVVKEAGPLERATRE